MLVRTDDCLSPSDLAAFLELDSDVLPRTISTCTGEWRFDEGTDCYTFWQEDDD